MLAAPYSIPLVVRKKRTMNVRFLVLPAGATR